MYRQWVALMDDEDADDVGVQGYLKLSIQIIGPGDKQKVIMRCVVLCCVVL